MTGLENLGGSANAPPLRPQACALPLDSIALPRCPRFDPPLHLQLAHHACVQTAGTTVALAPRDAALLAWLALEGPTARLRLASLLWPDSDPEAARNALRQRLFQLKKQLGVELVSGQVILALADGVHHDLEDSDSVLGGAAHAHSPEFDAWLAQQRERRTARTRATLVELADMAERSHDHADASSHAQELLALEPFSEAAHRRVMRLHYLRGDRAAALLAFDRCEQVLKNDVGARPSADTFALLATIEQSAASPGKGVGLVPGSARPVPASVQRPPRLIGREAAWSALHEAWNLNRCAVITGEAGMGKSRLATDFARARGAALTVSARPGDERVVYASFSRLLRELPGATLHALEAPLRKELARLLPELGARLTLP